MPDDRNMECVSSGQLFVVVLPAAPAAYCSVQAFTAQSPLRLEEPSSFP